MGVMTAPLVAMLVAIGLLWLVAWIGKAIRRSRIRRLRLVLGKTRANFMSPSERAKYLHLLMEDILAREITFAFIKGDMTDEERAWMCREMALKLGYVGLLPYYKDYRNRELSKKHSDKEQTDANRKAFLEAQEKQQDKGVAKANTLLGILGEEPKDETLGGILDGK